MTARTIRPLPLLVAATLACALLSACAPKKPVGTVMEAPAPTKALNITVVPTSLPITGARGIIYRQAMSLEEEHNLQGGPMVVDAVLSELLKEQKNIRFLGRDQVEAVLGSTTSQPLEAARVIGAKTGADAVLVTSLQRFTLRKGSSYSVEHPASVAFSLHLVDVVSGRVLCVASVDETQKSLAENLFSLEKAIGRGFLWISAEDLVREGLKEKLESCHILPLKPWL